GQEVPGGLCRLRDRCLCRPRCGRRPEGGLGASLLFPARSNRSHREIGQWRSFRLASPHAHLDAGRADVTDNTDSYVCGVADMPLLGITIGRSLDQAARRWGDREALVSPSHGVRWTWTELAERVDALAAGFLALGLERGARIGIWSLNRPEWTLTQFAAAKAG